MVTNNQLDIFINFEINYNLPKFKNNTNNDNNFIITGTVNNRVFIQPRFIGEDNSVDNNILIKEFVSNSVNYLDYLRKAINKGDLPIGKRIKYNFFLTVLPILLRNKTKKVNSEITYNSIEEFFNTLKGNKLELKKSKSVLENYEKIVTSARNNGQEALVDKLLALKDVIVSELVLIENGINTYATEEQVIKLYKTVEKSKNLKLTWIKNFTRVIPEDAIKLKEKADQINIFDNYAILHYDPNNEGSDLTNKQKEEKKKDPILFGLINNSNKLYFIADWIDEFDDLTLDKMMEMIDSKEFKLTNKSVISHIKNIK